MLDIKDIKKRKEYYNECFKKREYEVDLDKLINLYDKQVKIKQEQENLLALKNKGAKEFEFAKRNNVDNLEELQANLRANTQKIADLTKEYNEANEEYNKIFLALPNIVVYDCHPWSECRMSSVPSGSVWKALSNMDVTMLKTGRSEIV